MADRNYWEPKPPSNGIELTKRGLTVELCMYILRHSAKKEIDAIKDIQDAVKIWCQCAPINLRIVAIRPTTPSTEKRPLDLYLADLAGQTPCNPPPRAIIDQLLKIPRPECPDPSIAIPVFYVPGPHLEGGQATGCHAFRSRGDINPEHLIILTDLADGRVLAHELGHALFTRRNGLDPQGNVIWLNDDPDDNQDPASPIHNLDPSNLMYSGPHPDSNPQITEKQKNTAEVSVLVRPEDLAFGWEIHKLAVAFKKMIVHETHDEAGSDDALESLWHFEVGLLKSDYTTAIPATRKDWRQDPLPSATA
jgi:hypothetical protein